MALQTVYLIRTMPGWSNNVANRALAIAKMIIRDTYLAAYLAGAEAAGLEHDLAATLAGKFIEWVS